MVYKLLGLDEEILGFFDPPPEPDDGGVDCCA
jgi:hypothetical protein